jgi:DNA-binding IclR family transcriptional regulator
MAKSTLHGILSTLVEIGYVSQNPDTDLYQLGLRFFEIGSSISNNWNERQIASPYMQKILEQTGETVHMAVLSDGEVLYINKQESSRSIQIVTSNGVKLPAHCTGLGKALLSGLSSEEVKYICDAKGMAKLTEQTITSYEALMTELATVQERGYSVDNQEFMEGLRCIAVPVFNHSGKVTAAISIAGPISRMRDDDFEFNKKCLMIASREISKKLGYTGKFCKVVA